MARSQLLIGHFILLFFLFFLITPSLSSAQICHDSDNDGFGDPGNSACEYNIRDCDDTDPNVFPFNPDYRSICDGKDSNCDGLTDFPTDMDADGDGFKLCDLPPLKDCDDRPNGADGLPGTADDGANINASAPEAPPLSAVCSDGIDNDCDWIIDGNELSCQTPCYDQDMDGYYDVNSAPACTQPLNDCDDSLNGADGIPETADDGANINPGELDDTCDDIDQNCSGTPDDQYVAPVTNCGTGECADTGLLECQAGGNLVDTCTPKTAGTEGPAGPPQDPTCSDGLDNDCDGTFDNNILNTVNPDFECIPCQVIGTDDNCDGVDDDCDQISDDDYNASTTFCGVGQCSGNTGLLECQGGSTNDTCDPFAGATAEDNPVSTAPECNDGIDNDCDGVDDECGPVCFDNDSDGFGNPESVFCTYPMEDCDDTDPDVHPFSPSAPFKCDAKDTNCDGLVDFPTDTENDGDGVKACDFPRDCDDNNPNVYPGHPEGPVGDPTCTDGADNDCDGLTDSQDVIDIPNCAAPSCETKTNPRNGPHIFDLLDGNDQVITSSCIWCHTTDYQGTVVDERMACQRCHADLNDPSDVLNGILKEQSTAPQAPIAYPGIPPYGFGTAPDVKTHLHDANGAVTAPDCLTCHNPHLQEQDAKFGTSYGKMIKELICYDETALGSYVEELIEFTAATDTGSFADGPPHNENICEMCHTQTTYHRNYGSTPVHNDSTNCANCHLHSDGFQPVARSPHNTDYFNSNCELCHVNTQGTIDFLATIPNQTCNNCHGERRAHTSNPLSNPLASGKYLYDILCVDCHDPMMLVGNNRKLIRQSISMSIIPNSIILNTTLRGTESLADGDPRNENICETCHSLTSHNRGDGSGNGIHLDSIDYDGFYCMICHDHNKAFMTIGNTCVEENELGIICTP